jgi:AAA domain
MNNTTLIIGESGSGKSTSIRTLNAKETFIINILDKPLPFKGFKKNYFKATKEQPHGNYVATDNHFKIMEFIDAVNKRRPDIKNLIIDDFQYTMCNEFMRRATERGFDKFTEIGQHAWEIIKTLTECRDDLNCYILSHSALDDSGKFKFKTIGKLLDEKVTVEGMFTVVLHTIIMDSRYLFLTQNDGSHIAKSPMGMFKDKYIENDLAYVSQCIYSYNNDQMEDAA